MQRRFAAPEYKNPDNETKRKLINDIYELDRGIVAKRRNIIDRIISPYLKNKPVASENEMLIRNQMYRYMAHLFRRIQRKFLLKCKQI